MSTQWWQDGPEPRKIDVSVGKIYILLPRQKGQVLQIHSQLWRKLQHLTVPQLQLLLPEHYGLDLPHQTRRAQCRKSWSGFHFQGLSSLAGTIR